MTPTFERAPSLTPDKSSRLAGRWTAVRLIHRRDARSVVLHRFSRFGDHAMKLGLINSAWAQAGRGTSYGIRMTKQIGFDSIDIFTDPLDIDADERKLIKDECDRAGLPIVSVACV